MTLTNLLTQVGKKLGIIPKIRDKEFGELVDVFGCPANAPQGGIIHIAGPVEDTKRPLALSYDITDLVDSRLLQEGGLLYQKEHTKETQQAFADALRNLGQAYLDGRFQFENEQAVPINSEYFMLPVNGERLRGVTEEVRGLEDITIHGDIKQPLDAVMLTDYIFARMHTSNGDVEGAKAHLPAERGQQTTMEQAQDYLRELVFWRLNFADYSDHVGFTIAKRVKEDLGRPQTSFIIDRHWSKANQGPQGIFRVVDADNEKVVISGYSK